MDVESDFTAYVLSDGEEPICVTDSIVTAKESCAKDTLNLSILPYISGEWRSKLIALCEGLEIDNLGSLLSTGGVEDYRNLGKLLTKTVKERK